MKKINSNNNENNHNREKLNTISKKLRERNAEFKNSILKFDELIVFKNKSFQREFDCDMNELDKAVKHLF